MECSRFLSERSIVRRLLEGVSPLKEKALMGRSLQTGRPFYEVLKQHEIAMQSRYGVRPCREKDPNQT